ncbi:dithiol-disulfide isomerase [Acinetobacter proteolyticus]|uniref:DsbA family oxidoreductase n=1 Tax=Acinetobacter proteolyticus TaxID=1776741 RepID=A0A1E7R098_9GAMM|nr:DsbA family oxidoreductase [Acinetobacter proteolyticus]OEY92723.1 dithiol-disulfide isomerase [Acinetobacter proteolyticus]PKF37239.1 DsbA family oxidoreductase [Acinetobacter proteolyticus]QHH93292.1 DsbA family oxidoreductase [Acinetobacter gyllenbergii]WEI19167.1 DsbA family oxidoreductase [Acinetobacter proteolyticus]
MRVDIWSDVVCPFCYIGKKRLEHVAEEAGIELEIHWHSFELDPDAPAKHETSNTERLAKKYGRSYAEMEDMERNVAAMAATEGIDFQWQKANSGNSFNAHRIIHLAQSKGLGNEAEEAFFHAYMTEGLAIGEREVVEEIASRIGLDNAEVEYVLDSDELADFVRHDEQIAHEQLKVTGVPFFVFEQKLALSGAQPREVFLQALQQAQSSSNAEIEQTDAAQCNDDQCEIKH